MFKELISKENGVGYFILEILVGLRQNIYTLMIAYNIQIIKNQKKMKIYLLMYYF
jgi:hypothetical protein